MRKIILICTLLVAIFAVLPGSADGEVYYILCSTKTEINVRYAAKRASEKIGYLECGDAVETDGIRKNGWYHCIGIGTESGEGWVYGGYLVEDQPVKLSGTYATVTANGRVKCRQYINGKRQSWVTDGDKVKVYAYTSEWASTNKGFIRTEYLELAYE